MEKIQFRRLNSTRWETATNEPDLWQQLDGETAEIIMPAKPWWFRLFCKLFPPKEIKMN